MREGKGSQEYDRALWGGGRGGKSGQFHCDTYRILNLPKGDKHFHVDYTVETWAALL